jgi:large subunit ribosomal protein L25
MSAATRTEAISALRSLKQFRLYALNTNAKYRRVAPPPTEQTQSPPASPDAIFNPFLPWKNPQTGRWAPPQFSLRRQADLIKKARWIGPEAVALLPPGLKAKALPPSPSPQQRTWVHGKVTEVPTKTETWSSLLDKARAKSSAKKADNWHRPITWAGVVPPRTVRGKEVGHLSRLYAGRKRMFKGHAWERKMEEKMKKRMELLKVMNRTVQKYKSVSLLPFKYLVSMSRG